MRMASMRESQDSDRFLVNTQVQSHALLRRGFGTSVPFIGPGGTKYFEEVGPGDQFLWGTIHFVTGLLYVDSVPHKEKELASTSFGL